MACYGEGTGHCACRDCREDEVRAKVPRLFTLVRKGDESGVSGTGRVLDGVFFHTGQVVICWRTDIEAAKHGFSSLGIYPSWEAFEFIHVKSHPTNGTEVEWKV